MHMSTTNLIANLPDYNMNELPNWVTSEQYYNCEDFYEFLGKHHKKRKLFGRKKTS